MSYIDTYDMQHSNVFNIYAEQDDIQVDPEYQRNGDVWPLSKKQLLIDSLINRYDIPKLYFHKFDRDDAARIGKRYAIIDGRQRLEAIWQFINGDFALSEDFVYLKDDAVDAKGMTYQDLGKQHPKIKNRFDSTNLPIVVVETDDIDLIEEMFSRLNDGVPLTAPELRGGRIGGAMIRAINNVSSCGFFTKNIRITNKRYQHKEVAVRLLFIEHNLETNGKLVDTKRPLLDKFARDYKEGPQSEVDVIESRTLSVLGEMSSVFIEKDLLLRAQATIPIYYMVFRRAINEGSLARISRRAFEGFNEARQNNRVLAEENIENANFELLEFDRLSQQGTNDASNIRERGRILGEYILGVSVG